MTDPTRAPLEDLLAALRAPALPPETQDHDGIVDQMAAVIAGSQPSKEPARMSPSSRIPRAAVVAAVGVLGVGGVAAAATGTNPLDPVLGDEVPGPTTTELPTTALDTTTTVTESTEPPATTVLSAPPGVAPLEVVCPDDVVNHGDAVSAVAQDHTVTGADHGAAVSRIAQSDCGKTGDDEDEVVEPQGDATQATDEVPAPEVECPEGAANHGAAVSQVAKDRSTTGAAHGKAVSEMARSNCGK
jgi:hypothetical protein